MPTYYADSGINWIFVYEVIHEDDEILVMRDLGRFHKFDPERMWEKPIDQWIEIGREFTRTRGGDKLHEIVT